MSDGFDEDQRRFAGAFAISDYFASWDYACAFTGESLRSLLDLDPMSALLRLSPQAELRADLLLPACTDAQEAYAEFALRVGPSLNLILNPSAMSKPELLERLNPTFRLRMPNNPAFAPNTLVLADQCKALLDFRV